MPATPFRYVIEDFKGLNTRAAPEDLMPGEFTELDYLKIVEGSLVLDEGISTVLTLTDPVIAFTIWTSPQKPYLVVVTDDGVNRKFTFYSGPDWSTSETVLTDTYTGERPVFIKANDYLIIGGSHNHSHKNVRYWSGTTGRFGYNQIEHSSGELFRTEGLYVDDGAIDVLNYTFEIEATATEDSVASGSSFLKDDEVQYALSYTYDSSQESLLSIIPGKVTISEDGRNVSVFVKVFHGTINWRISFINIYRSLNGADFYLLTRLQVTSDDLTGDYGELNENNSWTVDFLEAYSTITVIDTGEVLLESYLARTGYSEYTASDEAVNWYLENTLDAKWKTATLCQGRTVIGNVKRYVGHKEQVFNDRLYFSPVGQYDSFYKHDWVDLESSDADEITVLESIGADVLVFKRNHLYIWDMGSRDKLSWYLKKKYSGYGVEHDYNVVNTPYGVFFKVTNGGLYLYNGNEPQEVAKKIRPDIETHDCALGYDPEYKVLYVGDYNSGFLYQIDLDDSWISTKNYSGLEGSYDYHFIYLDSNTYVYRVGKHLLAGDIQNIKDKTTIFVNPSFTTGKMDFGTHLPKRLDTIRINYKYTSDFSPIVNFIVETEEGHQRSISLTPSADYTVAEFYPGLYGRAFRFRLGVTGEVLTSFGLESVEITGRVYTR